MTDSPPALAVKRLSHSYGSRKALDDVSFNVERGCFAALLGLNGAGKSTLFSLVTGLYAARGGATSGGAARNIGGATSGGAARNIGGATSGGAARNIGGATSGGAARNIGGATSGGAARNIGGAVEIFGFDIANDPGQALRRLGVVFQARTLDLELSVMQNLLYHAALHGIGPVEGRRLAEAALARAGLADRAGDKARDLSGGQMRRVEIARALLHGPRLLLLDEPTVGLDIKARADILAHVRDLVRREGLAVLWTTHLIDEIEPCDQVVVLHRGRALANGVAAEIVAARGAAGIGEAFERLTAAEEG